jgi:hypothetical protein
MLSNALPFATLLAAVLVPATLPTVDATPSVSAQHVKVEYDCVHAKYEPKSILLACADGGFVLTRIHYTKWTAHRAKGSDRTEEKVCKPNCAAGTLAYHHDTFILDRVVKRGGKHLYSRARVFRKGELYATYPLVDKN